MRYLLIYYTGTYNTRFLSDQLQDRLVKQGHEVDRVEIKYNTEPVVINNYDYIGFSYPIYGFNSPLPFNKYIRKLSFPKGQKYFIYKNSGEVLAMNNTSSRVLKRIMKHRKCDFKGEYHFVLPYSIHFRFPTSFVRQALDHNNMLFDIMLFNLNHDIVNTIKANLIYQVASFFVSIQKIGGNVNSFLYRVDDNKCIKCQKCIRECPHNNVYLYKGKIKFHHHCDMCMNCSFHCPKDAIKIGFLQSWKVNGDYHLLDLVNQKDAYEPFVNNDTKGFYKCFINYFANIERQYQEINRMKE